MFFCWRKLWLILVVMIMAHMTTEVKAFPMQNSSLKTSTTAFTQSSSISPSRSRTTTLPMTVLMNLNNSRVPEPTMINTQASKISPTSITSLPISVNISSSITTVSPPTQAPRKGSNFKLVYIVYGAVVLVFVIILIMTTFRYIRYKAKEPEPELEDNRGNVGFTNSVMPCSLQEERENVVVPTSSTRQARENAGFTYSESCSLQVDHDVIESHDVHTLCSSRQESVKPGKGVSYMSKRVTSSGELSMPCVDVICKSSTAGKSREKASHQKNASVRSGMAKEVITVEGGTLKIDDVTFQIGPGCLKKDTEITMMTNKDNFRFKTLLDLELLSSYPRVIEFIPDGLKFECPADLTVRLDEGILTEQELFALHGTYSSESERMIWTVMTDDAKVNFEGQYVNMKINGFSLYTYIMSKRGRLARILSHLNNSFNCHAVALYRRMPTHINIAVVLISDFVETSPEVALLVKNQYRKCCDGALKRVDTHHRLEMCVEFPGIDAGSPHSFNIDLAQLDSVGMVIDRFREIKQDIPACGKIIIRELQKGSESILWTLDIQEEVLEEVVVPTPRPDDTYQDDLETDDTDTEVVMRKTKLTRKEITGLSRKMGMMDWDSLAGLLDIPYEDREAMRSNQSLDYHQNAEKILSKFNKSKDFCRDLLKKYLDEIRRSDLKEDMKTQDQDEPVDEPNEDNVSDVVLRDTRMSSREMYRLSRRIIDWDSLAGLMDMAKAERENIQGNNMYPDPASRTQKVLSLFNNSSNFCREKLVEYLKELKHLNLVDVVKDGRYRVPPVI